MEKNRIRIEDGFYESEQFYSIIKNLGKIYASDKQIAAVLSISPETFSRMKNGRYPSWSEKENKERSEKINQVLTHARENANTLLVDSYFKLAVGSATSKTIRYVQSKCECGGSDKRCPYCGGSGWVVLTDRAIVQEQQLPPNPQAIATLLYHYSEDWRKTGDVKSLLDEEFKRLEKLVDELPEEAVEQITERIIKMQEAKRTEQGISEESN